jgi:hypothetical protein
MNDIVDQLADAFVCEKMMVMIKLTGVALDSVMVAVKCVGK